jgi:membrane-bound ClpP family serine protease
MIASYDVLAIVLLVAGLLILTLEVFVPSAGVLAITTMVVLSLSALCAYTAWYQSAPAYWWTYCLVLTLAVPGTLIGAFYVLPATPFGKVALLEAPTLERVEPFVKETERLQQLVGQFGITQSRLNPGGFVLVDDERHHAFSEGLIVEPNSSVEVLEVRGTRLLVRPGEPPATTAPSESPQTDIAGEESPATRPAGVDIDWTVG